MPVSAATSSFRFNHTMFRVKDPKVSLPFYQDVMGMDLLRESDNGSFVLYFLGYKKWQPEAESVFAREAVLELTWNKGTEKEEGQVYVNGNEQEKQGFGHICITVDSLEEAVKHFDAHGVRFKKVSKLARTLCTLADRHFPVNSAPRMAACTTLPSSTTLTTTGSKSLRRNEAKAKPSLL